MSLILTHALAFLAGVYVGATALALCVAASRRDRAPWLVPPDSVPVEEMPWHERPAVTTGPGSIVSRPRRRRGGGGG